MASRGTSEYAGTEPDTNGGIGGGAIDPATLAGGSGADIGGGDGGPGDGDDFQRDASGAIIRNRDGTARRKPGRKGGGSDRGNSGGAKRSAGPRPSKSKDDLKASIDNLTGMLLIGHVTLAGVTNTPELELSEDESRTLARGIVPVLDQFDFVPDPRIAAVIGLIAASAKVYGPRAYLIRARLQAEKMAARDAAMRRVDPAGMVGDPPFGTVN